MAVTVVDGVADGFYGGNQHVHRLIPTSPGLGSTA
jgi:hypothetical protein